MCSGTVITAALQPCQSAAQTLAVYLPVGGETEGGGLFLCLQDGRHAEAVNTAHTIKLIGGETIIQLEYISTSACRAISCPRRVGATRHSGCFDEAGIQDVLTSV